MTKTCDRSATYSKVIGIGCPQDAITVTLHKSNGGIKVRLCSDHIKAYRASGIKVTFA